MKLEIKKWGINGEGIAYYKHKPVFMEGVIPTEVVECHITANKRTYAIAELDRILQRSARRRYPMCKQWQTCGGCALMHTQYKEQCKMKGQMVSEALRKYAHYTKKPSPIIKNPNPLSYRNACKLPLAYIQGQWKSGMYEKGTNHFVPMERCYVHSKLLEKTRQNILPIMNTYHLKELKTLIIKEFEQQIQVIFVTADIEMPDAFIQEVMQMDSVISIWQSIKTDDSLDVFGQEMKHLAGIESMSIQIHDLCCTLLPRSFFQLNTRQAIQLYDFVKEWTPDSRLIVEAYCGIGAMSLLVHDKAEKVIGVESNADAVSSAKENVLRNHIHNVDFICGDAAEEVSKINDINTLIVDPPRSGLSKEMKDTIIQSDIRTIIYVSCNPSTLGKDINILKKKYTIQKVQPMDMFSQTPHVETVVLMSRVKD